MDAKLKDVLQDKLTILRGKWDEMGLDVEHLENRHETVVQDIENLRLHDRRRAYASMTRYRKKKLWSRSNTS